MDMLQSSQLIFFCRASAVGDTTDALSAITGHVHLILVADVVPFPHQRLSTTPLPSLVLRTLATSPTPLAWLPFLLDVALLVSSPTLSSWSPSVVT